MGIRQVDDVQVSEAWLAIANVGVIHFGRRRNIHQNQIQTPSEPCTNLHLNQVQSLSEPGLTFIRTGPKLHQNPEEYFTST
ncbi:hypothetical protein CRENBAI_009897, partial [Crenichthys baileyi]